MAPFNPYAGIDYVEYLFLNPKVLTPNIIVPSDEEKNSLKEYFQNALGDLYYEYKEKFKFTKENYEGFSVEFPVTRFLIPARLYKAKLDDDKVHIAVGSHPISNSGWATRFDLRNNLLEHVKQVFDKLHELDIYRHTVEYDQKFRKLKEERDALWVWPKDSTVTIFKTTWDTHTVYSLMLPRWRTLSGSSCLLLVIPDPNFSPSPTCIPESMHPYYESMSVSSVWQLESITNATERRFSTVWDGTPIKSYNAYGKDEWPDFGFLPCKSIRDALEGAPMKVTTG